MYHVEVHEAGHYVVGKAMGEMPIAWQIEGNDAVVIFMRSFPDMEKETAEKILAAGAAAEIAVYGKLVSSAKGLSGDVSLFGDADRFADTAAALAKTLDKEAILSQAERMASQPMWRSF